MTRAYPVPSAGAAALGGAVGGAVAGAVAGVALSAGAVLAGHRAVAGVNAVGAWTVRWLQTADAEAIEHFYRDATLAGSAYILVAGAVIGVLFALCLARLPDDHPVAWGAILGVGAWVFVRAWLAPALDPALLRFFDWHVLLPTCLVYGVALGFWVQASRAVAALVAGRAAALA